ncbi:MAG: ATP-dependent helicase [Phototrophicales bacterium]|nr:MAG: ATP-dependent helicase [Phototrophicales bacterium]RMG73586.1 MAG: ATP-dependent helicase [Chloroflexota bacterium]
MTMSYEFQPRPKQKEVLKYKSGWMGVSAVPGSGKTQTLSALAAELIKHIKNDQEILIVTLVNAAARNFANRVDRFIEQMGLLPGIGYRVRTLHGLANDIVRERAGLVGLDETFRIVDERESNDILLDAVTSYLRANPRAGDMYLEHDMDENKANFILRDRFPQDLMTVASAFIKQAKDMKLEPEAVRRYLDRFQQPLPLAQICHAIYVDYQRALNYRGGVDFQDLIRLALKALETDADYLKRLQKRWVYILEDEAQDSSQLQEEILRTLAGKSGNWVRVGDPNQAIYETFTTADPKYLRDFLTEKGVKARELPNSGRSTLSIIKLANRLIDWTLAEHPVEEVRQKQPLTLPHIEPTPAGDPQPNPPDEPQKVVLYPEDFTPSEEIEAVVQSLKRWLPQNPERTVAVLVPRNERGAQVVKALKQHNIEVVELLRSSSSTRETAGALVYILDSLTNPNASASLAMAFKVWRRDDRHDKDLSTRLEKIVKVIRTCKQVEDYLYPRPESDWLETTNVAQLIAEDDTVYSQLLEFRELMRRWQQAFVLPVDQLILTIAADLFTTKADLAIAHSLAVYLRGLGHTNPHWRLPDFLVELRMVAQNKRRVVDLAEEQEYNPEAHKGKVTVATMHAAKGLEWDRVHLMSVNNYDFPSAEPQDRFIGEAWYVRDKLNLQAEALKQLEVAADTLGFHYNEGDASRLARVEYAAERLRLLYVGITRARRELIITWNHGRDGKVFQATPFIALQKWWDDQQKNKER